MRTRIHTADAPQATGPFSQAVQLEDLVFTSGQIHLTPAGKLLDGTPAEQTHQVMKNLQAILGAAGLSFDDVLKASTQRARWSV